MTNEASFVSLLFFLRVFKTLCAYENRLGCQMGKTGKYNITTGKDGSTVNQPHTFVWPQWTGHTQHHSCTHILKQREYFLLTSKSSSTSSYCKDEFYYPVHHSTKCLTIK